MKVQGPLFSHEASGTIGGILTYSKRQSGQQVRYQKKQKDANTILQGAQRFKFLKASTACRFMDYGEGFFGAAIYGHEKAPYITGAVGENLTGYNLCIEKNIDLL